MTDVYPALYLEGIRLFNSGEYFACHDVLEELWTDTLGEERAFYQGLIQAAVALFHFENGNLGGARKMYDSSRKYLEPYRPAYRGVDLDKLLADLEHCFQELLDAGNVYPEGVRLIADRVPSIRFSENTTDQATNGEAP